MTAHARTSPRTRGRLRGVAALLLAAAMATTLVACGEDDPVAEDPSEVDATTEPSGGTEPSEPAEEAPAEQVTVPVYFVGDTPEGPRLFREFRKVGSEDPLAEAAALLTAGDTRDPDYRTAYPSGSFASVEYVGGELHVVLPDDSWTTPAPLDSSDEGPLAAQQLVYTLQGVQQERAPVKVFVADDSGEPVTLFGVDTAPGLANDPQSLALVNVTTPEEGQVVSDTFTAEGVANSFEATVPWQIRRGEEVVLEGFSTAEGWMDKLYPWTTEVDVSGLQPGEYSFVALTDDPSGGAEGAGPTEDSKTIVVE